MFILLMLMLILMLMSYACAYALVKTSLNRNFVGGTLFTKRGGVEFAATEEKKKEKDLTTRPPDNRCRTLLLRLARLLNH